MSRRRLLIGLAVVTILGLTVWGLIILSAGNGKGMKANYDKIQEGMTAAEVDKLMGDSGSLTPAGSPNEDSYTRLWVEEEEGSVTVWFDRQDRVVAKDYADLPRKSFLDKIRNSLGL